MKKIKTINKLLSSLTLLSAFVGIGFNDQYKNTQNIITKNSNNSLNNYTNLNAEQVQMGDITVTVEGTSIIEYSSGEGTLLVSSYIRNISIDSFTYNQKIISLDLSNATSLTTIGDSAFYSCKNLTGDLVIPPSVTNIACHAFESSFDFVDLSNAQYLTYIDPTAFDPNFKDFSPPPKSNKNFSLATNLGPNAKVLTDNADGIWKDDSSVVGRLALGNILLSSSVTSIWDGAFSGAPITSLDLSQATSLTTIGDNAFYDCSHLSGDITIPSSVKSIGNQAFVNVTLDNLYFLSETPPTFGTNWQPTITGKVYVPSEEAKTKYTSASNFGFSQEQIEIGLPPEPTPIPKKSNTGLILGLILGLGIPIILAFGFIIWYLTKNKKTTVKI